MNYTIVPALLAIRGHNSARSFAMGPVMADPFISPFGFTLLSAYRTRTVSAEDLLFTKSLCGSSVPCGAMERAPIARRGLAAVRSAPDQSRHAACVEHQLRFVCALL